MEPSDLLDSDARQNAGSSVPLRHSTKRNERQSEPTDLQATVPDLNQIGQERRRSSAATAAFATRFGLRGLGVSPKTRGKTLRGTDRLSFEGQPPNVGRQGRISKREFGGRPQVHNLVSEESLCLAGKSVSAALVTFLLSSQVMRFVDAQTNPREIADRERLPVGLVSDARR